MLERYMQILLAARIDTDQGRGRSAMPKWELAFCGD